LVLKTIKPGEEPYLACLRESGRTIEEQGPTNFIGYFDIDYFLYKGLADELGDKIGQEIYRKLWAVYPEIWVKEAKLMLEIGKPQSLLEIADIITYCEKKKYTPYNIIEIFSDSFILESILCPFTEIATKIIGIKQDHSYFEAVYNRDEEFIINVIDKINMSSQLKLSIEKAICRGDEISRVVCKVK
jgi:hypothetical protein